jgi:hypothetical protein
MFALAAAASFAAAVPRYEDSWIAAAVDWPTRGVDRNDYASITAEITVDPRGYASDCHASATAGNPNMAPYTCQLLKKRAQFAPARDPGGRKIYGLHRSHLLWWNRDNMPEGLVPYDFAARVGPEIAKAQGDKLTRISYAVDASGSLLSCGPLSDKDDAAVAAEACKQLPQSLRRPVLDRKGKPTVAVEDALVKAVE